jgi:ABC-type uncharacterized transport system YnjBCD substrate-binding protein
LIPRDGIQEYLSTYWNPLFAVSNARAAEIPTPATSNEIASATCLINFELAAGKNAISSDPSSGNTPKLVNRFIA